MKWKTTLGMTLAGVMLAAPAWTHHAAQGIISDDIWLRIDDLVSDMHIEIFEEVMGSMRVDEAAEGGSMFLVTSVDGLTGAECDALEAEILEFLDDEIPDWTHDPTGDTDPNDHNDVEYNNALLPMPECICDGDDCTLVMSEPIGSVGWHDDEVDPAEEIADGQPGPNPDGAKKGK